VDVLVQGTDVDEPVREVEVNPTKEWDKEEGEDEKGDVANTGSHFLVVEVGKTTSGVAMQNDCLPSCVLNHSQQGVKHVVDHLCKSNTALGVERPTCPAKYIEGAMPEAIVAKGDDEIDAESVEDPIQVVKRSGGLDVVGRQKVDSQGNG